MKPTKDQIAIAVEAIVGEEATITSGYYGESWRIDSEHAPDIAAAALEAVLTDIEKRIKAHLDATENEASLTTWHDRREHLESVADGIQIALGILRGES